MSKEPMFNIEQPTPVIIAAGLVIIHALIAFSPVGLERDAISALAMTASNGNPFAGNPLQAITSLITHVFLHADWLHVLSNTAFIVIFGVLTIRATRNGRQLWRGKMLKGPAVFLLIFVLGAIGGGLAQYLFWAVESVLNTGNSGFGTAIGASTAGSALFATGAYALGGKDTMQKFTMVIGGVSIFFALISTASPHVPSIAWAAHLGGLAVGYYLAPKLLYAAGGHSRY